MNLYLLSKAGFSNFLQHYLTTAKIVPVPAECVGLARRYQPPVSIFAPAGACAMSEAKWHGDTNRQLVWARADLNCRPPDYQSGAPARLSYAPKKRALNID